MTDHDNVAAKVRERFAAADVTVQSAEKGYRVTIAEPGHRTMVATMEPAMVDTGTHLLWIARRDAERH